MLDHSTMNCRFGVTPIVCVLMLLSEPMMRSSQNGAIKEGGTLPTLPLGRVTLWAGSEAF